MLNLPTTCYYQPAWSEQFGDQLVIAESTRLGGVSPSPFASLNLGLYTDDAPEHVSENRRRFCAALGIGPERLAGAHQVHGADVLAVSAPGQWSGYDALITQTPNVFLTVTVADCTPILLYDPVGRSVGAAHAGWKGTVAGIAARTLERLQTDYGADPADCWAYIGTSIDECDFEVDADVADHFATTYKRWDAGRGKFFVDLKAANRDQLLRAGLREDHIAVSPFSTLTHVAAYFSHRAERGRTGRALGVVGMR